MLDVFPPLLLLFLFLGTRALRAEEAVPNPEPYKTEFFAILQKLNAALNTKGVPALELDPRIARVHFSDDPWGRKGVEVENNPAFEAEFFPFEEGTVHPHATYIYRDIPLPWLGAYDSPPKATWDANRAIQEAKFWVETLTGEPLAQVGSADATYEPQYNLPKYRDGHWTIRWPRVDGQGHRFVGDSIDCTLDEKYGVVAVGRNFHSAFKEGQPSKISADEAIALARPTVEKVAAAPMAGVRWPPGLIFKPDPKAEIMAVNANHVFRYKTIDEVPFPGDLTARLAWVTRFSASDKDGTKRVIYVCVDTETKEVLGGDFVEE